MNGDAPVEQCLDASKTQRATPGSGPLYELAQLDLRPNDKLLQRSSPIAKLACHQRVVFEGSAADTSCQAHRWAAGGADAAAAAAAIIGPPALRRHWHDEDMMLEALLLGSRLGRKGNK